MNNKDRFTLTPGKVRGEWKATDNAHGIEISFREHQFNETQHVSLLGGDAFSSMDQAMQMPRYLRELTDWIMAEHYNTAMPSLEFQRERMGQSIRDLRTQRGLTQVQLAQLAGITQSNLARIEAGRYAVGLDILNKIANAMGVAVELK